VKAQVWESSKFTLAGYLSLLLVVGRHGEYAPPSLNRTSAKGIWNRENHSLNWVCTKLRSDASAAA
jgi:hypothetical protein